MVMLLSWQRPAHLFLIAVIAALGSPVEAGWLMTGSIKTENNSGSANITVPISGPKQSARIAVIAYKSGGRWSYTQMVVTPERGGPINLLVRPDAGEAPAVPPAGQPR